MPPLKLKWSKLNLSLLVSRFDQSTLRPTMTEQNNPLNDAFRRKSRFASSRSHVYRFKLAVREYKSTMDKGPFQKVKAFAIINIQLTFSSLRAVQRYNLKGQVDVIVNGCIKTNMVLNKYLYHKINKNRVVGFKIPKSLSTRNLRTIVSYCNVF